MDTPDNFDFETFKQEAIKGLYSGKPLTGENGIFAPMLKHFLESALQGELDNHLNANKAEGIKNRKNGLSKKTIKSNGGSFELETPRDRDGSFNPQVVAKRQLVLTDTLERQIISMYSHGMSYSSINEQLEELYGYHLSVGELSNITDRVIPRLQEWQSRPLSRVYAVVWMDAMFYKVRVDGKVSSRAMYSVIGLGLDGKKEVLGIYLAETEGAKFWLSVLTDFKARGVEDILISCVDGLKGFPQAIEAVFPKTQIQLCVVHQIRYSTRFVYDKHLREFVKDLQLVYKAENLNMAE
ncbi:IS256 family transposase, partial [Arcicella sp. DC2W]